jgi:hypothetical protein
MRQAGRDLLDFLAEMDKPVEPARCHHAVGIRNGGYTLEHDPKSNYVGMWVHAAVDCRMPSVLRK